MGAGDGIRSGHAVLVLVTALAGAFAVALLGADRAGATFPPGKNGRLAFAAAPLTEPDIYTAKADGSTVQQFAEPGLDRDPVWSPDGKKLAYISDVDGDDDLYVRNADGSGTPVNLTSNGNTDRHPSWSPDGSRLAYTGRQGGDEEIALINTDGSNNVALTSNNADDRQPNWSPNGTKLAFASTRDGGDLDIFVMNADGSNVVQLTQNNAVDDMPGWSPDGTKIVFASDRNGNLDIFTMNANGTSPTQLTTDGAADREPAWSPDGTKIAFGSDRQGNEDVYLMNADGSSQTPLAVNLVTTRSPDWQRLNPSSSIDVPIVPIGYQSIENVKVYPYGNFADVYFFTTLATKKVWIELWEGVKGTPGAKVSLQAVQSSIAKKGWKVTRGSLTPRTQYQLYIYAVNPTLGVSAEYKHPTLVRTKQRNVTVTITNFVVIDDSDGDSCGDFLGDSYGFQFWLRRSADGPIVALKDFNQDACDGDVLYPNVQLALANVQEDHVTVGAGVSDDDGLGPNNKDSGEDEQSFDVGPTSFSIGGESRSGTVVLQTHSTCCTFGDAPVVKVFAHFQITYTPW